MLVVGQTRVAGNGECPGEEVRLRLEVVLHVDLAETKPQQILSIEGARDRIPNAEQSEKVCEPL